MVALDRGGLAAGLASAGLDDVRVDGALGQVLDPVELLGDGEELLPELRADAAALLLRVRHAGQQLGVALLGVHVDEGHVELLAEDLLHHLGLTLAKHAVVHEHAGELVADGAVHERGHDGGVDAAGEREDHLAVTHLLADCLDLLVDDVVHGPVGLEAADAKQEVLQDRLAVGGVAHLRMELRRIEVAAGVLHGGDGADVGGRRDGEALRHARHGVAMAHPHGLGVRRAVQDPACALARDGGGTILALLGVADLAAELDGHDLLPVAEAEDRNAEGEDLLVHVGGVVRVHGGRTAREDDGGGRHAGDLLRGDVARHDFRIDVKVAHAARDELAVLGAEVEDCDKLLGP